jgi:hypothetical protein
MDIELPGRIPRLLPLFLLVVLGAGLGAAESALHTTGWVNAVLFLPYCLVVIEVVRRERAQRGRSR